MPLRSPTPPLEEIAGIAWGTAIDIYGSRELEFVQ